MDMKMVKLTGTPLCPECGHKMWKSSKLRMSRSKVRQQYRCSFCNRRTVNPIVGEKC